jgi:hypothetical protein
MKLGLAMTGSRGWVSLKKAELTEANNLSDLSGQQKLAASVLVRSIAAER